jgi:hypothetical protein
MGHRVVHEGRIRVIFLVYWSCINRKRTRYADCIRVEVDLLQNPSWIRSRELRKLLGELIHWNHWVFKEAASELAIIARLADPGSEDEG